MTCVCILTPRPTVCVTSDNTSCVSVFSYGILISTLSLYGSRHLHPNAALPCPTAGTEDTAGHIWSMGFLSPFQTTQTLKSGIQGSGRPRHILLHSLRLREGKKPRQGHLEIRCLGSLPSYSVLPKPGNVSQSPVIDC